MPSPIQSLPPEILGIIFEELHISQNQDLDLGKARLASLNNVDTGESGDDGGSDSSSNISGGSEDDETTPELHKLASAVHERSFFPYSVALVCPYWEEVLSAVPEYWTILRVVCKVGWIEPIGCRRHLSYSRDLPIAVFMLRDLSCPDDIWSQVTEDMAVPGCMKALVPHLHRCRILYFDLTCNTTLPLLPHHVPDGTPLLRSIVFTVQSGLLQWDEDNCKHRFSTLLDDDPENILEGPGVEFKPRLKKLEIDGRNLRRALAEERSWIRDLEDLEEVRIAFYQPASVSAKRKEVEGTSYQTPRHECDDCALEASTVLEWLESLNSLSQMSFRAVNFKQLPRDTLPRMFYDFWHLDNVTFSQMNAEDIQEIARCAVFGRYLEDQTMIFWRCSRLSEVRFRRFNVYNLQLWSLDDDVDLARFLDQWDGQCLLIGECASFSDALLELLSAPYDHYSDGASVDEEDADSMSYPCPSMNELSLFFPDSTSAPYSIAALRKLVEGRGKGVNYDEEGWFEQFEHQEWGPVLHTIRLGGKTPDFTEEDQAWFKKHLVKFVVGDEWISSYP
ncbi:hypothetical protein CVT26_009887 [Gymnopilus dilepis]|uniref:F-box domain-containing protein n=1 Tax=Gymnopilus dilepis TaxID=231916 RepID=A0A409YC22_9AGAR|nr:hypothetical protein CVT26_009887 [Gymnopilus dilepis]